MSMDYRDFIVYSLHDSGEISETEVSENEVKKILDPKEVFMLVRQDLRRLFIWKGSVSPVRKRFISARRATALQEDIRKSGGRALKIVSVDQGDEPAEFLEAFHLESMPVTETLQELRYVRNAERDAEAENPNLAAAPPEGSTAHGKAEEFLPQKKEKTEFVPIEQTTAPVEEVAPARAPVTKAEPEHASSEPMLFEEAEAIPEPPKAEKPAPKTPPPAKSKPKPALKKVKPVEAEPVPAPAKASTPAVAQAKPIAKAPAAQPDKAAVDSALKDVLANAVPEGTKRVNIIIGNKLIGSIMQQKSMLGQSIESVVWSEFEELPNGCAEVAGIVRIYTDQKTGIVVAADLIQTDVNAKIELKENNVAQGSTPEEILSSVAAFPPPTGMQRVNVVLGSALYGPVVQHKSVLGKTVDKLAWEQISDLPGGCVELKGLIRIYVDAEANIVKAVDILENTEQSAPSGGESKASSPAKSESAAKRRKLPDIPKNEG